MLLTVLVKACVVSLGVLVICFVRGTEGNIIVQPFLSQHVNFIVYIPMTGPVSMTCIVTLECHTIYREAVYFASPCFNQRKLEFIKREFCFQG